MELILITKRTTSDIYVIPCRVFDREYYTVACVGQSAIDLE
jgi:hypothetical protein